MKINIGYVWNELRKAFEAKRENGNNDTTNADKRIKQWYDVLSGIHSGNLKIGKRKPTKYPEWVTLEVVRGGFATGKAAAAVSLSQGEKNAILALGIPYTRKALFLALLSDEGLAWLRNLLKTRRYKIELPEDAALLIVLWLQDNGREKDAALIVDEISKYASELRFTPQSTLEPLQSTELVHRFSSSDIRHKLKEYSSNQRIETQREALKIWIPFMDKLILHWLELFGDNFEESNKTLSPPESWRSIASELITEYEKLKEKYTLCRKYHNKKENLQILLSATQDILLNEVNPLAINRAQHVINCYTKAHGKPGEDRFTELRKEQKRIAALPAYSSIANVLADRLPVSDSGLSNIEEVLSPVSLQGHSDVIIPKSICKKVYSAMIASIPELVEQGIISSAEVMAELAPQLTASEICRAYTDKNIGLLIAETYKAFSRRRSLLLMNLSSQVRFDELPWVKPVIDERLSSGCYTQTALRLAAYAIDFYPGVLLPNPLVEQLNSLYWLAGKQRLFLAELAADIFTGQFVEKFDDAAFDAATLLRGSIYERYYNLDYSVFENHYSRTGASNKFNKGTNTLIEQAVKKHLDKDERHNQNFVVYNGKQIERAQIYTTHNLATLVTEGIKLKHSYEELATMAFNHSLCAIMRSIKAKRQGSNYLRAIKNAAYAWRQAIFFLSLSHEETVDTTIRKAEELFFCSLRADITREIFKRLRISRNEECSEENARSFLAWTSSPHWILELVSRSL